MKNKKVLFYSNVKNVDLFNTQMFYKIDINLLRSLEFEVIVTNRISDFFKINNYDYAFLYFFKYSFFGGLIAKLFNKKVYFTGGIDDLNSENRTIKIRQIVFLYLCYFVSDNCLIVSTSDLENVKSRLCFQKKLILCLHSIDLSNYFKNEKIDIKIKNDFATICWMEDINNVIRKGVDLSLKLFSYLIKKEEFQNSKFYIIGKQGPGSDFLKTIIINLGIEEHVIFTGVISEQEKVAILINTKYYFQLSKMEGFGIAALEALAAKNIVIHTGVGGLRDTIQNYGVIWNDDQDSMKLYTDLLNYDYQLLKLAEERIKETFALDKRKKIIQQVLNRGK